jgi:hypothetical protein
MGWANCGTDSDGRPIGYAHEAYCDHPWCTKKIDRGVFYACGEMHGSEGIDCEKYFCGLHRRSVEIHKDDQDGVDHTHGGVVHLCFACADAYEATPNGKAVLDR